MMLVSCLLSFFLNAQTFDSVAKVPNPRALHHWTTDAARLLPADEFGRLESILDGLNRDTGAEVAVVTLPSIGTRVPKEFATELFNTWKIGRRGHDDGLLILLVQDQRRLEMETGYGLEGALPDITLARIQRESMTPELKVGRPGRALIAGAERIAAAVRSEGPVPGWKRISRDFGWTEGLVALTALWVLVAIGQVFWAATRPDPYQRYAIVRRDFGWLFFWQMAAFTSIFAIAFLSRGDWIPVLEGTGGAALWYGLGSWVRKGWSSRLRERSRTCATCGARMVKQSAATEKTFESHNEQVEESIGSIDYDVWLCPAGHVRKDAYDGAHAPMFDACGACGARARTVSRDETVEPAGYGVSGLGVRHLLCLACNHASKEEYTIAALGSSSTYDGGGGGSSGGGGSDSFSGGSSGGGGAGSDW